MTIGHVLTHVIPAAFALLPAQMASPEAVAMLVAIGLQESKFAHRRQGGGGPARGFWQFERGGGVRGVMTHPSTRASLNDALKALSFESQIGRSIELHEVVEHNDTVACIFARLLLWTLPADLPTCDQPEVGWNQYLAAWRPGEPRHDSWPTHYTTAWAGLR